MEARGADVVGILIWYDEPVQWLMASIASVAPALDHLVAADGAYLLYPGALRRPASHVEQSVAVVEACNAAGLSFSLVRPRSPWTGNEVGKRNFALQHALQVAKPHDGWILVWDADQVARPFSAQHLRRDLVEAGEEYAAAEYGNVQARREVDGIDHGDDGYAVTRVRGVYRALPGLEYGPAHWTISAPVDGQRFWVWGNPKLHQPYASALDVSQTLVFDNRAERRSPARVAAAKTYYEKRDAVGAERVAELMVQGADGVLRPVVSS